MTTLRLVAGLLAALVITASSLAHSLLGWPAMRERLGQTTAPADLVTGLGIGWVWGGVCMAAFGLLLLWMISQAWRGAAIALAPFRIIGATYVLFGLGAWRVSGGDPFYAVFVVPGVLLLYTGLGSNAPRVRRG
ncbi:MAG TPA: hypothetical protein VFV33_21615 [Gemmatimonadaceae bacterium]|nr:hypothetical protein [Gemmatimonadaceae bacterium]